MTFPSRFVAGVAVLLLFPVLQTVEGQSNPPSNSGPQVLRNSGPDITPPRPTYAPDPEYSERATKAGLQGSCEISLIVGTDGLAHDVKITKSLGMGLDENSVTAVRSWKFEPARKNGIPVAAQITVEISFRLASGNTEEILSKLPTVTAPPVVMRVEECQTQESLREKPRSEPEVVVADLAFEGVQQVSVSEQQQIATDIKWGRYMGSLQTATDEITERARASWQNRGYFKVHVTAESRELTSSPTSRRIAITVNVDEGPLYHLGGITFKNNHAIRSQETLRGLFPIKDGDVLSREKIAEGLEALRKAYGEFGYINFTEVPDTEFDDESGLVYLHIDCDEGEQFYISGVTLLGSKQRDLVSAAADLPFKPSDIYNSRLVELFLRKDAASLRFDDPNIVAREVDVNNGTIALTFDLRNCPSSRYR
jgi:TonB family protein